MGRRRLGSLDLECQTLPGFHAEAIGVHVSGWVDGPLQEHGGGDFRTLRVIGFLLLQPRDDPAMRRVSLGLQFGFGVSRSGGGSDTSSCQYLQPVGFKGLMERTMLSVRPRVPLQPVGRIGMGGLPQNRGSAPEVRWRS